MRGQVENYLSYLETGDYTSLMNLFSAEAVVISPLYGRQQAVTFYKRLFEDTSDSKITPLSIFADTSSGQAAAHFQFDWTLSDGTPAPFEVVDLFTFNDELKITQLKIIYDTQHTRQQFEGLSNNG